MTTVHQNYLKKLKTKCFYKIVSFTFMLLNKPIFGPIHFKKK